MSVCCNTIIAAQSYHSYQISVPVINVGLRIGPLSEKSKDPGSLGKNSLFYWGKNSRNCHPQNRDDSADVVRLMNALNSSQVQRLKIYSPPVLRMRLV